MEYKITPQDTLISIAQNDYTIDGGLLPVGQDLMRVASDIDHLEAENANLQSLLDEQVATYEAKANKDESEIARLQAIVEKLPLTADGVRVVPDNEPFVVFSPSGDPGEVNLCSSIGWAVWPVESRKNMESWPKQTTECYSTKEAALAAGEAK